jgi:hypothetical protein
LAFRDPYELPGPGRVGIWKIEKIKKMATDECELPMTRITKDRTTTAYSEYLLGLQRSK